MDDTFRKTYHHPFHQLWTATVGLPNYNKREWGELDIRLSQAWMERNNRKASQVLAEAVTLQKRQMS